jgi:hypothetical protein
MAFTATGGYTNLPNGNFSPTIYSQKALKSFRKLSVVEDVTNTDFYGEINNFGDTVRVMLEPSITVSDYSRGATPTTQDLTDSDFSLTVNQAKVYQFQIEDIERAHSHVNFEDLAANNAAYKLKDTFDTNVLRYMADNADGSTQYIGSTWVSTTETVAAVRVATAATANNSTIFTPLSLLNRIKRKMDIANIPQDNRFFIGDPVFYEQLNDEDSKLMATYYTGANESPLFNGKVTDKRLRGFELYESNNLYQAGSGPDASYGGSTNYGTLIAGHRSAVAAVNQILKTEKFRSPTRFADVIRGLHVFGRGYVRDDAVWIVRYAIGA